MKNTSKNHTVDTVFWSEAEYIARDHTCPTGKDVYLTSRDGEGRRKRKYSRNNVKEYTYLC